MAFALVTLQWSIYIEINKIGSGESQYEKIQLIQIHNIEL